MQEHKWRIRDEGKLRFFLATHHAGTWKLASRLEDEDHWNTHDPMTREDWQNLRKILWNKYQRRRCPWKIIEKIDKFLETLPGND